MVASPLIRVTTIVTLLKSLLIATHEPPSRVQLREPQNATPEPQDDRLVCATAGIRGLLSHSARSVTSL